MEPILIDPEYTPRTREEALIIAAWESDERYGHIPSVEQNAQVFLNLKQYANIKPIPMTPLQREEVSTGQS